EDVINGTPAVGDNALSALVNNTLADLGTPLPTPYDWSLLNVNGDHGGDIFTTTLQRPGAKIPVETDLWPTGFFFRDERPWLRLIDGISWREDNLTTTSVLFRINPQLQTPGNAATAVWIANSIPNQVYEIQATWLSDVVTKLDNPNVVDDPT